MSTPAEDDRTVLAPSGSSGAGNDHPHDHDHALPVGTRLNEFEITGILGEGGFGIVYCAHDTTLERQVALKEYMPSFASRKTQAHVKAHVGVKSAHDADSFEAGLRSFINEARLLAQFDHPSLVKVYRFWEANGTAYMVMPYYRGATLKQALQERSAPPDEAWLKALLGPLLDALDVIHQHQCFHRDIAPDNILMLDEGRPLLLDFGAARRAISGMNQAFTVILKQNYAPIEQYAEMPGMSQGAWTDLYALASVVHFAIAGSPPPPALGRMVTDPYVPLATRFAGQYSHGFLEAIDRALAFKPDDRPHSVAEMRALLGLQPAAQREPLPPAHAHAPAPAAVPASAPPPAMPPDVAAPPATPGHAPARRGRAVAIGVGAVVLGAAGLLAYSTLGHRTAPVTATAAPAARTADVPSPAPAAAPAPVTAAFDPVAALDAIVAGANPARKVEVEVPNRRLRIGRDKFAFAVRSSHAGHVYIYTVGTQGNDFHLLFPNARDRNNRIGAGEVLHLPRSTWRIEAYGPPGTDHFVVMVSDAPRDFGAAGLANENPFPVFPVGQAARLQAAYTGKTPLFAGTPACTDAPCPADYGAAAFTIDEVR
jgi:serine/threonine protein kinase